MTSPTCAPPAAVPEPAPMRRLRPGISLALVCTAMFMLMLDMTIVAVALPDIQQSLDAGLGALQWVVDAYTLPLAALLLTAATLADRIGRKRVFIAGMAVFTAGSLTCALAVDSLMLDTMRGLQGIGAAMLFGTAMPIMGDAYPDLRRRAKAIGIFGATLASATAVGPLVGGMIVDNVGWQWIFAINVPIGVVALVASWRYLNESRAIAPRDADWVGTALLTLSLGALVFGLIRGQSSGWTAPLIVGAFVTAAAALIAFVRHASRVRAPLVDLELFRRPAFVGINLTGLITAGTIIAVTNYVGLYYVNTLGYSPFMAGVYFLPLTIAAFVAAPVVARIAGRVDAVWTLGGSLLLVTVGLLWASRIDGSSGWTTLAPGFVLCGIGLGASSAVLSGDALSTVEADRAGMATGVVNTMRQIGTAAGVAALGAVFTSRTASSVTAALAPMHLPAGDVGRLADAVSSGAGRLVARHTPPALQQQVAQIAVDSTAHGIHVILLVAGIVGAVGLVVCTYLLSRGRRPDAIGRHRMQTARGAHSHTTHRVPSGA